MLYLNHKPLEVKHFPDNTQMLLDLSSYDLDQTSSPVITWHYESDEECMTLFYITRHIQEHMPYSKIVLDMYYCPNARMDRVKSDNEVFTLKWFCEFINSLGFYKVRILDPHSNVTTALFNHCEVFDVKRYIRGVLRIAFTTGTFSEHYVYFPDAGAMKRYKDVLDDIDVRLIYGSKNRDWKTGEILGLDIFDANGTKMDSKSLEGKTVLMIDDIISYGGTMAYSADKLKELGASKIFAYATHVENSILDKEKGTFVKRLENGVVEKLYTTNSIYKGKHPKIVKL